MYYNLNDQRNKYGCLFNYPYQKEKERPKSFPFLFKWIVYGTAILIASQFATIIAGK